MPTNLIPGTTTISTQDTAVQELSEEEKRRRAAIASLGLSLPSRGATIAPGGNIPMVQGTPQAAGVPFVQGTLPTAGAPAAQPQQMPPSQSWSIAQQATRMQPAQMQGAPMSMPFPPTPIQGAPTHVPFQQTASQPYFPSTSQATNPLRAVRRSGKSPGLLMRSLLIGGVAFILIVSGIITAGLTVFRPALTIAGSTTVAPGQVIHLHGSNFLPRSTVVLTLDGSQPLYYSDATPADQSVHSTGTGAGLAIISGPAHISHDSALSNVIIAAGNGTFDVNIPVNPNWPAGAHTIRASEKGTPRSATLDFTMSQPATTTTTATATDTPTSTDTQTPTPTPTDTPSTGFTPSPPTPTPTPVSTAKLTCANPNSVNLSAQQGNNQSATKQISLCTTGTGALTWTATWTKATWLKLDHTSGQINAPGKGTVNVSANASGLNVGGYTADITFKSAGGTQKVHVAFTVQPNCTPGASPTSLSFNVAANSSQNMTVKLFDCGGVETWPVTISTQDQGNWLTVQPMNPTVSGTSETDVQVTVTPPHAGTFSGSVSFNAGTVTYTVTVTVTATAPTG